MDSKTRRPILFTLILLLPFTQVPAQDIHALKHEIATLSGPSMQGRGYVFRGREVAAKHIIRRFKEIGLKPATWDSSYVQTYTFPVNIFPDTVSLRINDKELVPGEDFLIDAASPSFHAKKLKISTVDLGKITDSADWEQQRKELTRANRFYYLKGLDTLYKVLSIRPRQLAGMLPKAAYLIPVHGKMSWTVSTSTIPATVFYVEDTVLPHKLKKAGIDVNSMLEPAAKSSNIIGMVKGTALPDSFLVFTAHYDHLGRMGADALFPGASDNASGTALMLYLANYYAAHPQRYSMLFIAFSGEEAGLLGSTYFVKHPLVPLQQMRFLVNLDIMGDATDGVTVVNATEFPKEFSLLESLNKKKNYLPQVKSRGKAANSDHYPFSEAGVPAFFLYSNSGKGYYHDVFDKPASLSLNNVLNVAKLLQDFVTAIQ